MDTIYTYIQGLRYPTVLATTWFICFHVTFHANSSILGNHSIIMLIVMFDTDDRLYWHEKLYCNYHWYTVQGSAQAIFSGGNLVCTVFEDCCCIFE